MWVNKSVNPSQTSTRAAQATPPRMTPGPNSGGLRHTHRAARGTLPPQRTRRFTAPAPRGSREVLQCQRSRGTAAQIPAAGLPSDAHAAACAPE